MRTDRTKSVEAFAAGKLHVALLQIARGDVVEAGVAEEISKRIVGVAQMRAAAANNEGEFAFVLYLLGKLRQHHGFFRAHDRRGWLEKNQGLLGNFVAEFGGVRGVIAAHANNLGRLDGSKEANIGQTRKVRAACPCPPRHTGDFSHTFAFDKSKARGRR